MSGNGSLVGVLQWSCVGIEFECSNEGESSFCFNIWAIQPHVFWPAFSGRDDYSFVEYGRCQLIEPPWRPGHAGYVECRSISQSPKVIDCQVTDDVEKNFVWKCLDGSCIDYSISTSGGYQLDVAREDAGEPSRTWLNADGCEFALVVINLNAFLINIYLLKFQPYLCNPESVSPESKKIPQKRACLE